MKYLSQGIGYAVISVERGTVCKGFNRRVVVLGVHFGRFLVLTSEAVSIILLLWVAGVCFRRLTGLGMGLEQSYFNLFKIIKGQASSL